MQKQDLAWKVMKTDDVIGYLAVMNERSDTWIGYRDYVYSGFIELKLIL